MGFVGGEHTTSLQSDRWTCDGQVQVQHAKPLSKPNAAIPCDQKPIFLVPFWMSQVRLTLRPPPNSEFVQGYPGIPPAAPDRPQASVTGALEVRTPGEIKAKWVRIELRKVETLPGGGLNNTYVDFVGGQPVGLWTSNQGEEWSNLNSLDFPFSFRIPESLPPSLTLENGAGIKYELLASVCTKGKRNFFRRRKQNIISTQTGILIDKHELHSIWPIYSKPEAREMKSEGVTLLVERTNTCYGPGDRITIQATVKSDAMHTVILRGFEFSLRESMILRPARFTPSKSSTGGGPQSVVKTLSETKLPVNVTLFGGMTHTSEISCHVSPHHSTTSLNSARCIDVTYLLLVKALMGTGAHLEMELPVVLSNWQRDVSEEAIRRIGPVPSLGSLLSIPVPISAESTPTMGGRLNLSNAGTPTPSLDEFGGIRMPGDRTDTAKSTTKSSATGRNWPRAEDEKQRLFNQARQRADEMQDLAAKVQAVKSSRNQNTTPPSTPPIQSPPPALASTPSPPPIKSPTPSSTSTPWPTAEQEKLRLFNQAQAAVHKAQYDDNPPSSGSSKTTPPPQTVSSSSPPPVINPNPPAGGSYGSAAQEKALLKRYYEAKKAVERSAASDGFGAATTNTSLAAGPAPVNGLGGPVPYDSLYPDTAGGGGSSSSSSSPGGVVIKDAKTALEEKMRLRKVYEMRDVEVEAETPPGYAPPAHAFQSPQSQFVQQSESELESESQLGPPGPESISSAMREKEMLRRQFEARDAAAAAAATTRTSDTSRLRPRPTPPPAQVGGKVMTAVEEKALLKARYEAGSKPYLNGNGGGGGGGGGNSTPSSYSPSPSPPPSLAPPPLMPRPPMSYIQETREEDARVSRFAMDGVIPEDDDVYLGIRSPPTNGRY